MKLYRVYGMILRYIYNFKHSYDRITDALYWPALDLTLWGLTSAYFTSISTNTTGTTTTTLVVSGLLFWILVWRAQYEISVNLLQELWDKNMINIFAAPLTLSEWVYTVISVGILKASLSFSFASVLAYFMYGVNIFQYGFYLPIFFVLLIMSGWWAGFLVASLILRYGTRIQTLAWSLIWVVSPFAAIYYPVSFLPNWAQKISLIVPMSYIFESGRDILTKGHTDISNFAISFLLSSFYLILSLIFLKRSFNKVLNKGLVKLY